MFEFLLQTQISKCWIYQSAITASRNTYSQKHRMAKRTSSMNKTYSFHILWQYLLVENLYTHCKTEHNARDRELIDTRRNIKKLQGKWYSKNAEGTQNIEYHSTLYNLKPRIVVHHCFGKCKMKRTSFTHKKINPYQCFPFHQSYLSIEVQSLRTVKIHCTVLQI